MVDNTVLNAGAGGDTIASDDIGGIKHQRVKVQHGADGSATDTSDAAPMPVEIGDGTDQVLVSAAGALITDSSAIDQPVTGDTAHDAADSGEPVKVGGKATDGAPTEVADGDRVDAWHTLRGAVVNRGDAIVDDGNSSTTPLGISGVFTGTGVDVTGYHSMSLVVLADEDAATAGLSIEFSTDNSNWDEAFAHDILADVGEAFIIPRIAQFFRIVYTNGTTAQTSFRMQTILNAYPMGSIIAELNINLVDEDLASTTRSVLAAKTPGGSYTNIQATTGGNLKVAVEETNGAEFPVKGVDVENAAAVENPILVAGRFDSSPRTLDDGDIGAIALDADGAVHVSDGGNSLTVDAPTGTPVNVQIGDGTDQVLVNASGEMQVSSAVTDVVPGVGATNLGKAEDAAHSSGDVGVMPLAVRNDDLATLAGADGDYAPLQVTQNGALLMCPAANDDYLYAVIDDAGSGDNTLIAAAGANIKIRVLAYVLVASAAVDARFESGAAGTALTGAMELAAATGVSAGFNPAGHFETAANALLNLELSGAVSVDGHITYILVDTS